MAVVEERKRDYSLIPSYTTDTPLDDDTIEEKVEQTWWSPDIPRPELKALMQRSDRYGLLDFGLWIVLLAVSGTLAWMSWGTWWAIPAFLVFGTIYSSADARWHECGHGTVFRTRWLNEVFYHISSFMTIREAYLWRWSHARHHTNTIIVGYDPEIQVQRPADLIRLLMDFIYVRSGPTEIWRVIKHAAGQPDEGVRSFVPASEISKMVWSSRIYLLIVAAFAVWAVAIGSFLPLMFVWLPRFYGGWLHQLLGLTQHAGLGEDSYDHRENTRTVYVNPVFRYLYLNMNYHLEHHVIPMVPYHTLAELHEAMKPQTPPPYRNLWECYKEMIPALIKQAMEDPDYHIKRSIPAAGTTVESIDIPMAGEITPPSMLVGEPVEDTTDTTAASDWADVCAAADIDENDVHGFEHNGRVYAIYRLGSDEFYASDGICTHEETELAGGYVFDGCIECPLHLGRFDVKTGKAMGAPVKDDLKTYPVELRGDRVFIQLGD
jgi:MocE subfamily Rieske [2Fe-2S] domain protein